MNHQEQNDFGVGDNVVETNKPSSSTFFSVNNSDTSKSILEHDQNMCDPAKYLDMQRMHIEQGNAIMTLKICEYEKRLTEKNNAIESLRAVLMNSQHNNYIITNQNMNITERSNSVNDTSIRLNARFTDICEYLSRIESTVDNAKTRQEEITNLVDHTTNLFQEIVLDISNKIDDSLKQVNMDKIRTKQELDVLENKYSLDLIACKIDLEECTKEIDNLMSENNLLLIKLNEANSKLNGVEESVSSLNQHFGNKLREMENKNILLNNQYESKSVEYNEIQIQNQSLNDEISILKTSLDENKIKLDLQLNINKEQTKLLNNLKISEELNDKLKKDNCTLNERNEYLEKVNTDLMQDISNNKMSENKNQEEKEKKFEEMCKSYDDLLKMQEEKLLDVTNKLELQKENENDAQNELIDLKQNVEMCNKVIINLNEELKANCIIIPELQSKIDDLNTELSSTYQKLRDSTKEFMTEKNEIEKNKYELETKNKEYFKQIEKLTSNYMKYKSKAKQMFLEVMKLRHQLQSEPKKSKHNPTLETIEIVSDEEADDDVSIVEPNTSNMDVSVQSISNKLNESSSSSFKRNLSPSVKIHNSRIKTLRMSMDTSASSKTTTSMKIIKQKNNIQEIESSLNLSLKSNNRSYNKLEGSFECTKNVKDIDKINNTLQKENFDVHNESKNQMNKSISNIGTNIANKKTFKMPAIPADTKPAQKKIKSGMQKNILSKPNSPVLLTFASPKHLHKTVGE